jgi:hypothetical protein
LGNNEGGLTFALPEVWRRQTSESHQPRPRLSAENDRRKFGARRFAAASVLQPMLSVFGNGRFDFRKSKTLKGRP